MGLDIYVGSYTRYYSGNWETIVQQMGRESGMDVQVIRAPSGEAVEETTADPSEIREAVAGWRKSLSEGLAANLESPLDWDESDDAPYFTDKPDWVGYACLLLWAVYSEHADLKRPDGVTAEWFSDPAFRRSQSADFRTSYPSLIMDNTAWLPAKFMFNFNTDDLGGGEVVFGSAYSLKDELHNLNVKTWDADESTISKWRRCEEEPDSLEKMAQCSFAMFWELAQAAIRHRLIMKLDF